MLDILGTYVCVCMLLHSQVHEEATALLAVLCQKLKYPTWLTLHGWGSNTQVSSSLKPP